MIHLCKPRSSIDHDVATKQLDKGHFARACQTLNASLANEKLTQEQIDADFETLDVHSNGTIGFIEVRITLSHYRSKCHVWLCIAYNMMKHVHRHIANPCLN